MVDFLRDFLFRRKGRAAEADGAHSASELQLAVAALLVEAAKLDGAFDEVERRRIGEILVSRLGIDAAATDALIAAADDETELAGGLYGFTSEIRRNFEHAERVSMIEMLWEVAYADGVLHDFEANLLRRVAGLLYVTDRESGEARKRVLDGPGREDRSPGEPGKGE